MGHGPHNGPELKKINNIDYRLNLTPEEGKSSAPLSRKMNDAQKSGGRNHRQVPQFVLLVPRNGLTQSEEGWAQPLATWMS